MKRNVVLICADQWRGDCLSVAGHPDVHTPAIDKMASTGALLERAYSATPTCVPARMSLMTGLKPETHGRIGYADGVRFNANVTLPGAFRDAGYRTQAIGKMHYWPERARIGFDDVILHDGYLHHSRHSNRDVREYDDYVPWLRQQPQESATADISDNALGCNSIMARPWEKAERLHPTNWVVSEAERWLHRRDPEAPFFLYLSFHRPHAPFDPPQWAWDQYVDRDLAAPAAGDWTEHLDEWRNNDDPEAHVADYRDDVSHRARAGYYGLMTHIDHQIFRFLQMLGEFGVAEDTVVAFVSDHGDMMGDHGMWRKGYAYEGSSHIPFVLTGPGIPSGVRCDALVELRDVMPTLLEAAGVEVPDSVEGVSILPMLHGGPVRRQYLHGEHFIFGQSMQWIATHQWKYVWWSSDGHEQLFDLITDPREERNLASSPEHLANLHQCRDSLIEALRGREEGYVQDGALVAGQAAKPMLDVAHSAMVGGAPGTT